PAAEAGQQVPDEDLDAVLPSNLAKAAADARGRGRISLRGPLQIHAQRRELVDVAAAEPVLRARARPESPAQPPGSRSPVEPERADRVRRGEGRPARRGPAPR